MREYNLYVSVKKQKILLPSIMAERINFDNLLFALVGVGS